MNDVEGGVIERIPADVVDDASRCGEMAVVWDERVSSSRVRLGASKDLVWTNGR